MSKDYKLGILFGLLVLAAGVVYWVALEKPQGDTPEQQQQDEKVEIFDTNAPSEAPPSTPMVVEEQVTTVAEQPAPSDVVSVSGAPATPSAPATPAGKIPDISGTVEATSGGFILADNADDVLNAEDPVVEPTPLVVPERVIPTKKGEYIVREGDNGFSTVSQRVYGTRKYWPLIAKANPGVRSTALRVGMKLKYPPKPNEAVAAATTPTSPTTAQGKTYTDATGRKIYVVASNDTSGFSGISKKVYKTTKHWKLIADANPGVDTTKLKPGMKLVIPPVETATLATPSSPRTTRTGAEPGKTVTIKGQRFYIVKAGDAGFDYIANKVYGSAKYGKLIAQANPNVSSTTLMPRDKLRIPPKPAGPPPGSASSSRRSTTTRTRDPQPVTRDSGRPYFD